MKTQEIVDFILQNLFDNFWIKDREGNLRDFSFAEIMKNKFEDHGPEFLRANSNKIAEIAYRHRMNDKLADLEKELKYIIDNWPKTWYKGFLFFTKDYTAKDILDLGFLPQSCTSFSIYAFDLLKLLGVKELKIERFYHPSRAEAKKGKGSIHSVLVYNDKEEGRLKRCDPKWQKHPDFFKRFPEYGEGFLNIDDPRRFVHGKSKETPLWYTEPKTLRQY